MQPARNASVGDVFRVNPSPYDAKTSPEMGQFIREARKLTRNNTFIGMEATKRDSGEQIQLKQSWNRWNSAENLCVNRPEQSDLSKARAGESMPTIVPLKLLQPTNGSESTDDDSSGTKASGRLPNDRRCSMIPLMCQPAGRPKVPHAPVERGNLVRKKPPVPPKALAKHQDPIKIFRAERLQEKKMDMEQQLEALREHIADAELARQREDRLIREIIDLLKREIDNLKCTCDKLTDAVQRLQSSDDLFLKMKHEGEYSFYARSYEVSKKILSNTFRRRKSNSARSACFRPNTAPSREAEANFQDERDQCALSDTGSNTARSIEQPSVSSGGDGDYSLGRANSAPETPMNIVTSLYYVSKIQSVEMDDVSRERNDTENPPLQTSDQELITKKKTKMSKIGGWFKPGKR